jgi:hypothetical protein
VITLKYLIEETFEGVEFKKEIHVNFKNYKSIFLKLNIMHGYFHHINLRRCSAKLDSLYGVILNEKK